MKHSYFIIFLLISLVALSACSSTSVVVPKEQVPQNVSVLPPVITNTSTVKSLDSPFEYIVKLNDETTLSLDGKSAILKITGANSNSKSVMLSVKQGTGENVKSILANQVISFGALRICINSVLVDGKTGDAQVTLVPTYSQKAVAWFSMAAPTNVNQTCSIFERAVSLSGEKDGAVTFFSEILSKITPQSDFVTKAYLQLIGKTMDPLNLQAWEYYVAQNGRDKFLALLVASNDFKEHEASIK